MLTGGIIQGLSSVGYERIIWRLFREHAIGAFSFGLKIHEQIKFLPLDPLSNVLCMQGVTAQRGGGRGEGGGLCAYIAAECTCGKINDPKMECRSSRLRCMLRENSPWCISSRKFISRILSIVSGDYDSVGDGQSPYSDGLRKIQPVQARNATVTH